MQASLRQMPVISALRPVAGRIPRSLRVALAGVFLFSASAALFAAIQFATPGLAGNDGYYHVKMAHLMRQDGLTPLFVWLPLSILSPKGFYDHHLLYHVYLALFIPGDPAAASPETLAQAAKIASVVMPSLAFTAVWWLLRGQGVRWAWLWALGLFAVSDAFLYRMSMPRAQSASLLVLALGLHWLLTRRYRLLLPLGFAYVWLYNAFPLLVIMTGVYVAATLARERRLEWEPLVFVGAGIVLGLLVNPYFPQNVTFILKHIAPKVGAPDTRVGVEWDPYRTWTLVENSAGALAALVAGTLALGWSEKRMDRATLTALLLAVVFGAMAFRSRRFIEYFPAFALIFAALSVSRLLEGVRSRRGRALAALALAVVLAAAGARSVNRAREALADSKPADLYAASATWLAENSPPGSLVFQTDWDDFPRLFFYNTSNIYTIGLDITYMQLFSPGLYEEWVAITRGQVSQPGEVIASRFGGSYVFSDLDHDGFLEEAADDPALVEVYRDEQAVIFEVVAPGE